MEIRINGEVMDATLESEDRLGDVVRELQAWLSEGSARIRSLSADGKELDLSMFAQWQHRDLHDIGVVELGVTSRIELQAEKLSSLHDYFSIIASGAGSRSEVVSDLLTEAESVLELLANTVSRDVAEDFLKRCESSADGDHEEAMSAFARSLLPVLEDRYAELSDPKKCLQATLPSLKEAIAGLAEVSAYLQNGEDAKAMTIVVGFLELAQKLIRIGVALSDRGFAGVELAEMANGGDFRELLGELSDAIADSDTITIGDLLEYEIGPRFNEMVNAYESAELSAS